VQPLVEKVSCFADFPASHEGQQQCVFEHLSLGAASPDAHNFADHGFQQMHAAGVVALCESQRCAADRWDDRTGCQSALLDKPAKRLDARHGSVACRCCEQTHVRIDKGEACTREVGFGVDLGGVPKVPRYVIAVGLKPPSSETASVMMLMGNPSETEGCTWRS
jgi:hypothetical protein